MGVTVLLLSPLRKCTGNYATICRLREELERNRIRCLLACPSQFLTSAQLCAYVQKNNVCVVLGIHAYKSGRFLKDANVPYVLILGGTDVNGANQDPEVIRAMTSALQRASCIVSFSKSFDKMFRCRWPNIGLEKSFIIPQAVAVYPNDFSLKNYIRNHGVEIDHYCMEEAFPVGKDIECFRSCDTDDVRIFSIVGGIRPVKNPLYVVKEFSEWRRTSHNYHCFLVIIGQKLDEEYFQHFSAEILQLSGVIYVPCLARDDCHAAIRDSFALVNTSDSEGMALTILEAMQLKTPVLVRGIPSNLAIVEDGHTGLVFNTPLEFIDKVSHLLQHQDTISRLTQNASEHLSQKHTVEAEEAAYISAIQRALNNKG